MEDRIPDDQVVVEVDGSLVSFEIHESFRVLFARQFGDDLLHCLNGGIVETVGDGGGGTFDSESTHHDTFVVIGPGGETQSIGARQQVA